MRPVLVLFWLSLVSSFDYFLFLSSDEHNITMFNNSLLYNPSECIRECGQYSVGTIRMDRNTFLETQMPLSKSHSGLLANAVVVILIVVSLVVVLTEQTGQ
jgi:hypothetical protein